MEELMRLMVVGPSDRPTEETSSVEMLRFEPENGQDGDLRKALMDYGESTDFVSAPDSLNRVQAATRLRQEVSDNPSVIDSYTDKAVELVQSSDWITARQRINNSLLAAKIVGKGGAPARRQIKNEFAAGSRIGSPFIGQPFMKLLKDCKCVSQTL